MTSNARLDPYIAAQIAAKDRPSVIKTKLLNLRSKYPNGLIIAVEGNDDKIIFSYWIARSIPDLHYEFMICGGKRQIRQLNNSLAYDVTGLANEFKAIVDRDFDDLIDFEMTDFIFLLDRYSVENYIVTIDVINKCLAIAFHCDGLPDLRSKICEIFASDYRAFLDATRELNRRIYHARRTNVDIDGSIPSSLDSLVCIALGATAPKFCDLAKLLPYDDQHLVDIKDDLDAEFDSFEPELRYRGKFAYKFLKKWLELLALEFRTRNLGMFASVERDERRVVHDELSLGSLASRSQIPDGFEKFLLGLR